MIDNNILSDKELDIIKRGRNAQIKTIAKNADVITYRLATGFEAIIGYWHLMGKVSKIQETWDKLGL